MSKTCYTGKVHCPCEKYVGKMLVLKKEIRYSAVGEIVFCLSVEHIHNATPSFTFLNILWRDEYRQLDVYCENKYYPVWVASNVVTILGEE